MGVYAPFGRGQLLSSDNKVVDTPIGSWNPDGIVSFSSGTPFDAGTGKDLTDSGK